MHVLNFKRTFFCKTLIIDVHCTNKYPQEVEIGNILISKCSKKDYFRVTTEMTISRLLEDGNIFLSRKLDCRLKTL